MCRAVTRHEAEEAHRIIATHPRAGLASSLTEQKGGGGRARARFQSAPMSGGFTRDSGCDSTTASGLSRRRNLACNELGIVFDPTDQCRPTGVLPGEAEEVEPRQIGDTAAMTRLTRRRVEDRRLDPRPVRAISRGPDHRIHPEVAAIRERDRSSRGAQSPRLQIDAIAAPELTWTRPDQRLSLSDAPPNPRLNGLVATTTCSASMLRPSRSSTKVPSFLSSDLTGLFRSTGSSNVVAYRSR